MSPFGYQVQSLAEKVGMALESALSGIFVNVTTDMNRRRRPHRRNTIFCDG